MIHPPIFSQVVMGGSEACTGLQRALIYPMSMFLERGRKPESQQGLREDRSGFQTQNLPSVSQQGGCHGGSVLPKPSIEIIAPSSRILIKVRSSWWGMVWEQFLRRCSTVGDRLPAAQVSTSACQAIIIPV